MTTSLLFKLIADLRNQYYLTTSGEQVNLNDTSTEDEAWYNEPITETEIAEARKCLVNGKSPGLDGVYPELLKYGKEETDWYLRPLFQFCLDHTGTGAWPQGLDHGALTTEA